MTPDVALVIRGISRARAWIWRERAGLRDKGAVCLVTDREKYYLYDARCESPGY